MKGRGRCTKHSCEMKGRGETPRDAKAPLLLVMNNCPTVLVSEPKDCGHNDSILTLQWSAIGNNDSPLLAFIHAKKPLALRHCAMHPRHIARKSKQQPTARSQRVHITHNNPFTFSAATQFAGAITYLLPNEIGLSSFPYSWRGF
jgi:hypothetical protein